jgi:signal transduction histidine kinase/integral membrane sensor domain MASE1/CheY-like chemotaxis protein
VVILVLAAVYLCSGRLGLMLAIPPGVASPVWPPSGLALAAVMLLGTWVWPGIWIGSFVLNSISLMALPNLGPGAVLATAAAIATGSTLQPLVGAVVLRRVIGDRHPLERTRDALCFAALGAVFGCLISATVGVSAVCLARVVPWPEFGVNWATWWLGDAAGVLILTPLLIRWSRRAPHDLRQRWLELVLCFALALLIAAAAFASDPGGAGPSRVLAVLLLPFLVWAAARFGAQESLTLLFVIASIAVWGTIHHRGPFAAPMVGESLLRLEIFLSVAASIALLVGAAATERRRAERSLQQVHGELEERVREHTVELRRANETLSAEVAERKRAERHLRMVVERAPAILWSVDRELRFTSALGNGLQALELAPAGVLGKTVSELFDTGDQTALPVSAHRRALLGETVMFEQAWNGVTYQVRIEPLHDESRVVTGCSGMAFDITERTRAESERLRIERRLLEAQKLESLGVMSGGIAHDFNNLLTGILGNASLLASRLPADPASRGHVEGIVLSSQRAAELCRQMLAYSGRGRFVLQRVDLNRLVQETSQLLGTVISRKARLQFDCADRLPAVEVDATQIRQVLMNLVLNASEALDEQVGTIRLSTGVQSLDAAALAEIHHSPDAVAGEYVWFEVSDNGAGMTAGTLARLFDPFFTTKFLGRGLGLSAVLGIVRGHRGALKVESAPGVGSQFRVLLPQVAGEVEADPTPRPMTADWRGSGCVLLVEDEGLVREFLTGLLAGWGFEVVAAVNGREGVDLFRANAERLVFALVDLTMPEMGGGEAFAEMRRIRPSVPVLLMSGYDEETAVAGFDSAGLAGALHKPFSPDDLRQRLQSILG